MISNIRIPQLFINSSPTLQSMKLHSNSKLKQKKFYAVNQNNGEECKDFAWKQSVSKYLKIKPNRIKEPSSKKIVSGNTMLLSDDKYKRELFFLTMLDEEYPGYLDVPEATHDNKINEALKTKSYFKNISLIMSKAGTKKKKKIAKNILKFQKGPRPELKAKNSIIPKSPKKKLLDELWWKHFQNQINLFSSAYNILMDMRFSTCKNRKTFDWITKVTSANKGIQIPFNIIFINMDKNLQHSKEVEGDSYISNSVLMTSGSYNTLSPDIRKEELVYLSPDANETMTKYDHNKTYIIGGLVDKGFEDRSHLTASVARVEGITALKLPSHLFLLHGLEGNSFDIETVFLVISTLRETNSDWLSAFKHIPIRSHRGLTEYGKEMAVNRPEILKHYIKGETEFENHLNKSSEIQSTSQSRYLSSF